MLIVTLQNITPSKRLNETKGKDCTYQAVVRVNERILWVGYVEGHDRAAGWPTLLSMLAAVAGPQPCALHNYTEVKVKEEE